MKSFILSLIILFAIVGESKAVDSIFPLTLPVEVKFTDERNKTYIKVICIDGYKWIVSQKQYGDFTTIAQLFENGKDNGFYPPQPVKCK